MQIVFDPAALLVGCRDDADPGRADLGKLGPHLRGEPLIVQLQRRGRRHGMQDMPVGAQRRVVQEHSDHAPAAPDRSDRVVRTGRDGPSVGIQVVVGGAGAVQAGVGDAQRRVAEHAGQQVT